jgi:hypothetical protein
MVKNSLWAYFDQKGKNCRFDRLGNFVPTRIGEKTCTKKKKNSLFLSLSLSQTLTPFLSFSSSLFFLSPSLPSSPSPFPSCSYILFKIRTMFCEFYF